MLKMPVVMHHLTVGARMLADSHSGPDRVSGSASDVDLDLSSQATAAR